MSDPKNPQYKTPPISWPAGRVLQPPTREDMERLSNDDAELEDLIRAARAKSELPPDEPLPPVEHVPFDAAAEKSAFADLIAFFADNPEDDTEVTHLALDDFDVIPPPGDKT